MDGQTREQVPREILDSSERESSVSRDGRSDGLGFSPSASPMKRSLTENDSRSREPEACTYTVFAPFAFRQSVFL